MAENNPQERVQIPELPPTSADFDSFIDVASRGVIPADELAARLLARDGYARNSDGDIPYRESGGILSYFGKAFSQSIREDRIVTPEQRRVISEVGERVSTLKATEKGLQDTASFLQDVLLSVIPADELAARLLTRDGYARNGDGDIPYRGSGGILRYFGKAFSQSIREDRIVTPEQRRVIEYIAQSAADRAPKQMTAQADRIAQAIVGEGLSIQVVAEQSKQLGLDTTTSNDLIALANLNGTVADKAISRAIRTLLVSGNDSDILRTLDQQRAEFADISDTAERRTEITTLGTYIQTARRINVRTQFWQQSGNADSALRTLEAYEIVDELDKALVGELRNEALAIRRDGLIANTYELLGKESPDFTAAALVLGATAKTASDLGEPADLDILATLAESTYQAEVNLFFGNLVQQLRVNRQQIADVVAQLDAAPIRPAIAGVDYFTKFQAAKEQFLGITDRLDAFAFEGELIELRKRFPNDSNVQGLVQEIIDLPGETPEDTQLRQALLTELALVTTAQRGINPGRFALLKEVEVEGLRARRIEERVKIDLKETIPDRNIAAVSNLVRRFQAGIMPLFEALRGGASGNVLVDKYVSGKTGERAAYVQRVKALEDQRDLSDIEQAYLESVELLSVFNPHLVALAKEKPELTSLYLEQYFSSMDLFTKENLMADSYVPVLQVGLGPNGVAAAGELNRVNADVAAQTLFVDGAPLPGGPFGRAKGQSWELNSANSISQTTNNLPDVFPPDAQGISVRSYGSPLVSYPGERKADADIREGSINVTVDYLLNPDNISKKRYPTNADLARVLQLQSAMLIDCVMLSTKVVSVQPLEDGRPGNKRVTLEYQTPQGETVMTTIRTDAVIVAGGLGEPNFGIDLPGSQAEQILLQNKSVADGFPRLTDTIGAFSILSNPEGEPAAPQGTVVIYGGGNSADVLIEYLGRQFESDNPNLNGIKKVYVLTTAELSKRPRYAQINDLKSRNGQASFLELVSTRVTDVRDAGAGKIELLDGNGRPITVGRNGGTKVLQADHVISASGFRPMLDEVFKELFTDGESLNRRTGLGKVSLPSNPGFSIADELLGDPSVVIVGTGSRADFKNPNKLGQLPVQAREALLRNGAENAVAIGFRTPDTRAAIRLKFGNKVFDNPSELPRRKQELLIDTGAVIENFRGSVAIAKPSVLPLTRRDVDANSDTLSALFLEALPPMRLAEGSEVLAPSARAATTEYRLQLQFNAQSGQCSVQSDMPLPQALVASVEESLANPYFQSYAMKAFRGRRVNRGLEVSLAFNRGTLQYRDPGVVEGKGRTYVEVL